MPITLFPGRSCRVSFRPTVAVGEAILTDQNTINAEPDSKIIVQIGGKSHYVVVVATTQINNLANRDNVILHGAMQNATGRFRRISEARYRLNKAFGTRKAQVSFLAIIISIGAGAFGSINAAQHAASSAQACTGLKCVTTPTWFLMALSAASALVAWTRDNIL